MPQMTLLQIDGVDFSQYSVRGLTMTLTPIDQASQMARDCRGNLVDISLDQFKQFKISVSCTDHSAPELTDVWPGKDITVDCIPGLGPSSNSDDVLTLLCKVTSWNTSRDEWAAEVAWTLEAEQRVIDEATA